MHPPSDQPEQPPGDSDSTDDPGRSDDAHPLLNSTQEGSYIATPPLGTFQEPHSTPIPFVVILILLPAAFGFIFYFFAERKPSAKKPAHASTAIPAHARALVAPTLLISIDGFRHDYLFRSINGSALAPTLQHLANAGVRAQPGMQPVMPTKTFPNHWALATGLYAESHGIIGNIMYNPRTEQWFHPSVKDPSWWHGEPIWKTLSSTPRVAVLENGTHVSLDDKYTTGAVFWVGSSVKGLEPDAMWQYDASIPYDRRVNRAVELLKGEAKDLGRPAQFVALYFDGVDRAGHFHGPGSHEVNAEIQLVDATIARLLAKLGPSAESEYNIVIVSDHGMADVTKDRTIDLSEQLSHGSVQDVSTTPLGLWINHTVSAEQVYGKLLARSKSVGAKEELFSVFRKHTMPERWHLSKSPLVTEVVTLAKVGWTVKYPHQQLVPGARFVTKRAASSPPSVLSPDVEHKGQHGFDNTEADMQATFIAVGPAFKNGTTVNGLKSVDIYPMLCHMFGAVAAPNNGSLEISKRFILSSD